MGDNWDDSDDDWDKSDDELDRRLGAAKIGGDEAPPAFDDDEEDLTLKEKEADERANQKVNKAKGSALAKKKAAEAAEKEELELAKKAMALEAEREATMTPAQARAAALEREEEDGAAMADALFGGPAKGSTGPAGDRGKAMMSGDKVVLNDLKDHLRHAKKVGECIKGHGKVNLASAFMNELVQQCKEVLDDAAVTEIIKACNIIKNEKVQQAKRKVKGQAQKSKKDDKALKKKAKDINKDVFGDNDNYDDYDEIGGAYEDDFF